jgi:hypothetical protein
VILPVVVTRTVLRELPESVSVNLILDPIIFRRVCRDAVLTILRKLRKLGRVLTDDQRQTRGAILRVVPVREILALTVSTGHVHSLCRFVLANSYNHA